MAQKTEAPSGQAAHRDLDTLAPEERMAVPGELTEGGQPPSGQAPAAKPRRKAPLIIIAVVVAIAVFFAWRHYRQWVSTDDAQIRGHIYPISARIAGHVIKVTVDNTQYVDKGTVLVELDPTGYQVAVERAQAQLADAQAAARAAQVGVPITSINTLSQVHSAQADVESAQAGITAAERQFQAAEAKLSEAEAKNVEAQDNLKRYAELVSKFEVSRQQYDSAVATAKGSAATVAAAQASAAAAEQQVAQARSRLVNAQAALRYSHTRPQQLRVMRARAAAAAASVAAAQAALHQAELNLQYTTIVAPTTGVVGKRSVVAGQNIQPGQELMALVPIENIWVTANFKETQLQHMRVGQPVKIHVDAFNRDYNGHVVGIAGATGVQFSLLPPENATGNYVKVVQRVPVRIAFDKGQNSHHLLRVGMSVEPHVKVNGKEQ